MLKNYFTCFLILLLSIKLQAQPSICGNNPQMTSTCGQACIICDIDGFTGVNDSPLVGTAPSDFCAGQIHNIQWIGFISGSEDLTLSIAVSDCQMSTGLQIGLYESTDCINTTLISNCIGDVPNNSTADFSNTQPLTPGAYYYLVIDGAFGDICNYTVNVTEGSTLVPNIFVPSNITEEEVVCINQPTNYSATEVVGATDYQWTINNAPVANGLDMTYSYPAAGAYTVCVTASNVCSVGPPACTVVVLPPTIPTQREEEFCVGGDCMIIDGVTICGPGVFEAILQDEDGCDSLVNIIVLPLLPSIINLEETICEGETFEFNGETISEEMVYEKVDINEAGCDSITFLLLNVEPAASMDEEGLICEGESYSVGDESFTETGVYEVLVPGAPGECAEIVNLDLTVTAILEEFLEEEICGGTSFEVGTESFSTTGMYDVELLTDEGCDSLVHLDLTVLELQQISLIESICDGQNFEVGTESFNATGNYEVVLSDENGCDSTVNLALTVVTALTTDLTEVICDGESYEVGPESFNATGDYSVTMMSSAGCDSIVSLDLMVVTALTTDLTEMICTGESYEVGPESFNTTGDYSVTMMSSAGCDSIVSLDLTVVTALTTDLTEVICDGESYEVGPESFNATGDYSVTMMSSAGCDSIVSLDLSVVTALTTDLVEVICDGESYEVGSESFNATGDYSVTMMSTAGCDSIVSLDLTVVTALTTDLVEVICDGESYEVGPESFNATGDYSVTMMSSAGCDSIVSLDLSVVTALTTDLVEVICDGESYEVGPESFNATGDYSVTMMSSAGCDSIVSLDLMVVTALTTDLEETICDGQSFEIGLESFNTTGNYSVTLTSDSGCDSIVSLDLEVLTFLTTNLTETICDGDSFEVGLESFNATGDYSTTLIADSGCDSIVNLNLTVVTALMTDLEEVICEGGSFEVGLESFSEPGDYSVTMMSSAGCDSIVNLELDILIPLNTDLEETICDGDSYEIGIESFNTTGNYSVTLTANSGCDSIVNLDLEVLTFLSTSLEEMICEGDSYEIGMESFNTTGNYSVTLASSAGCDSIVSLDLEVLTFLSTNLVENICEGETFEVGLESFAATGNYSVSLTAESGCDSIVSLDLTVLEPIIENLTESICEGEEYEIDTETFTSSGNYSVTLLSAAGCDSIVNLALDVIPPVIENEEMFICEGESVEIGIETFTTTGNFEVNLTAVSGCDSIFFLDLIVYELDEETISESICAGESVTVGTEEFTLTGDYVVNLLNENGCDSTVILILNVSPTENTPIVTSICAGEIYEVGDESFSETGEYIIPLTTAEGCDSTVELSLTVLIDDLTNLDIDLCTGETYDVGNETFSTTGEHQVTLQNQDGCDSLVVLNLSIAACNILGEATAENASCFGEEDGSFSFQVSAGNLPFTYTYQNTVGTTNGTGTIDEFSQLETISNLPAGNYEINLIDAEGLELTLNTAITQPTLLIGSINESSSISCFNATDGSLEASISAGGTAPYSYLWSNGTTTGNANNLAAGEYQVTVTDAHDCSIILTSQITEPSAIAFATEQEDPTCLTKVGTISITETTGGTEPYMYALNDNSSSANTEFVNLAADNYTIIVEDANGCVADTIINMPNAPLLILDLGIDDEIILGDSVNLSPIYGFTADSIIWEGVNITCDTCETTYVTPTESSDYTLTVFNEEGCEVTDNIRIIVDKGYSIYVPTAFSPNNSGTNDILFIQSSSGVELINSFQIYSRWGEPVYQFYNFEPNDPSFGWNGRYRSDVMNTGVFIWVSEVLFTDGHIETFTGDVTLMK